MYWLYYSNCCWVKSNMLCKNEWLKICQIDNCFSSRELLFKYVTYLLLLEKMCEIAITFIYHTRKLRDKSVNFKTMVALCNCFTRLNQSNIWSKSKIKLMLNVLWTRDMYSMPRNANVNMILHQCKYFCTLNDGCKNIFLRFRIK